jgi:Squalene-hopene cyclase C-terminal domain
VIRRLSAPLAAASLAVLLAAPAAQAASTPSSRALAYLTTRKGAGGCYAEPGATASPSLTGWVVIGQRAAGASGFDGATCIASNLSKLVQPTDVELAILAIRAAGYSPRGVSGVNLVARLDDAVSTTGEIGDLTNSHIFGVLAFRAANQSLPGGARTFLASSQLPDGSFGLADGDSNLTAAGIEALRAARYAATSKPVRRALAALGRYRNADGGFGLEASSRSDAQSTAWALQAYAATGQSHARFARRARTFLLGLQRANGSFRYSRRSGVTPVWVTSQVLAGLSGKALPIR